MTNIASVAQVAAIVGEFGEDNICAFIYEDGARCLRLSTHKGAQSERWEDHDDAIPQAPSLERMRKEVKKG